MSLNFAVIDLRVTMATTETLRDYFTDKGRKYIESHGLMNTVRILFCAVCVNDGSIIRNRKYMKYHKVMGQPGSPAIPYLSPFFPSAEICPNTMQSLPKIYKEAYDFDCLCIQYTNKLLLYN